MRKTKYLAVLCAVICLITAFSISASAASNVSSQMAANSAAWHIANAAGDTKTCAALHAANVALASSASSGGGSSSYNSNSGTWSITTSSGSTISSSGSSSGKSTTVSYTTTTSGGSTSRTSSSSYTDSSISAYMGAGGTSSGLQTSYNNAANGVSSSGKYGNETTTKSAENEAAVAKALLGLTDSQAKQLQAGLEASKQAFVDAQQAYNEAVSSGNTAAAEAAKAKMDNAHNQAQNTRTSFGYTGDSSSYNDGGYYSGNGSGGGSNPSDGGGFYVSDITPTYKITVSAGAGGSVSPSGTISVKKNSSQTISINPNSGFNIDNVTVDGSSKGAISSYTFSNVTSAHTISATFKANGKISIGDASVTDALGADLSSGTIKSGYGIFASVNGSHSNVTNVKMTMTYNFGHGSKTINLQETSTGVFSFLKNSDSPTGKRCVYIPVETKDGTYTLALTFTAQNAAGETLTETKNVSVTVKGTMYEDDFTGNS